MQNSGYTDNPTDIRIISVKSNLDKFYNAGQIIFCGTAIAKNGNDHLTKA
uniref:Uncharacterized protein n=1 Tax=Rhizophagus irregularis (strain DAOM 181602 / DAOM 197198 / MUCL 43194) TaxID=747089 RepID=U9T6Q6_RHIID